MQPLCFSFTEAVKGESVTGQANGGNDDGLVTVQQT